MIVTVEFGALQSRKSPAIVSFISYVHIILYSIRIRPHYLYFNTNCDKKVYYIKNTNEGENPIINDADKDIPKEIDTNTFNYSNVNVDAINSMYPN